MTTQAQIIEALNIGKAACLIACALEPIRDNWTKWENAADIIDKQIATLTAAAEVEDDDPLNAKMYAEAYFDECMRLKAELEAAIERCAQELDNHRPSCCSIRHFTGL